MSNSERLKGWLVDDQPLNLELGRSTLGGECVDLETFSDPRPLVKKFQCDTSAIDLLISDFNYGLPDYNGLQFISEMRRLSSSLVIVLCSETDFDPQTFNAIRPVADFNWRKFDLTPKALAQKMPSVRALVSERRKQVTSR